MKCPPTHIVQNTVPCVFVNLFILIHTIPHGIPKIPRRNELQGYDTTEAPLFPSMLFVSFRPADLHTSVSSPRRTHITGTPLAFVNSLYLAA